MGALAREVLCDACNAAVVEVLLLLLLVVAVAVAVVVLGDSG